jgi:putative oxidoreductase
MKFPVSRLTPFLQSALRLAAAFIFMAHGTQKLFAFPGGSKVAIGSLMGAAGVIESVGGALILVGLFTRPVAFVLAGEMAVAYYMTHMPQGRWPIQNGGELAVLFCFIWLFFSAAGPGPLSADALRGHR